MKPNFIAGQWLDSAASVANINPSDTRDTIDHYAQADAGMAEAAIAAAHEAKAAWGFCSPQARADALDRIGAEILARREELGRLLSREEGKTLPEGIGEVTRAGNIFKFYAGEALRQRGDKLASVRPGIEIDVTREPVGTVGIIAPWNFPIAIPAWKIAPALAYGNTVVFKPAELVPGCAWALAEIISRAGLPAGVFNLVMGRGSQVGQALLDDRRIDAISFTGSVATGRRVAQAATQRMAKAQLEMGGKNPMVVLDDADLDVAVECAVQSAFYSTGQRCTASSRIIVEQGVYARFLQKLRDRAASLRIGHALEAGTDIGPVASRDQLEQNLRYVDIGEAGRRAVAVRRRRAATRHAGPLHGARHLRGLRQRHAHLPRGNLRAGRGGHAGTRLRTRAGPCQRHGIRPCHGDRVLHHGEDRAARSRLRPSMVACRPRRDGLRRCLLIGADFRHRAAAQFSQVLACGRPRDPAAHVGR